MSKQIYIIRHGETDFNQRGIVQGSGIDSDLNDKGWAQAAAFYCHFNNIPFNKVYTSSLKRTHQSVNAFTSYMPFEQHSALNEISWGGYEGKEVTAADKKNFRELIHNWKLGRLD